MKISRIKNSRCQGSVLVVAIVLCGVIGLVMATFMQLVNARTKIRARSLAWNTAIPVLEGGIEEAFTHLQDDTNLLTLNGWAAVLTNSTIVYQKTRTNSGNTYCFVTISNALSSNPSIYSKGFVPAPLGQGYVSRLVQVTLKRSSTFPKAIQAKGKVDLSGQSMVDSFDSSNTNYSTGGQYDITKRRANGAVVTNSRGTPAVDVGNGHIYGQVDTGPGGTVTVNGSGGVGDTSWTTGIEPGYVNNDMNVSYLDQYPPTGYQSWPQPLAVTNNYLVVNGNYSFPAGLNLNSGSTVLVQGDCNLYIGGNLSIGGGASISLAPGATLNLYVNGATASISGGGIVNSGGTAANFSYHGTTNNTTLTYSGSADFIGTIDAPEANVTITGGASVFGAAICNTYTSRSSGAGFHYDESLFGPGILKLVSYREL